MNNRAALVFALTMCLIGLVAANFVCVAIGISAPEKAADRSIFQLVAYIALFVSESVSPVLFERESEC